jgi:hypothetical protein
MPMGKEKANASKEMTITGYVEEFENEEGNSGVIISDGDYEFVVVMDKQGKKLLDYMDEEVEATGIVTKKSGVREIKVINFRLTDEYEDDEEYYDDDEGDEDDDFFGNRRSK